MLSDPVSWLDVLVLLAAYLLACLVFKVVTAMLRARDTFDAITTETGDEAAPGPQDEGSADHSSEVCTPAASSPDDGLMVVPVTNDQAQILCNRRGCDMYSDLVGSAHKHTDGA